MSMSWILNFVSKIMVAAYLNTSHQNSKLFNCGNLITKICFMQGYSLLLVNPLIFHAFNIFAFLNSQTIREKST